MMKAVVWNAPDFEHLVIQEADIPKPGKGELLVRVVTTDLNPADWKSALLGSKKFPAIMGRDFAGYVTHLGEEVSSFKIGDAVFGWGTGQGSFAEFCIAKADFALKKPESLKFEDAVTLPLNLTTAGQAFKELGFPLVDKPKMSIGDGKFILIWGGSTAVGAYAIQLAHLIGFRVIATSSPHNFEYLQSLGADYTVDYHSSDVSKRIKEIAADLEFVIECSGEPSDTLSQILQGSKPVKLAYVHKLATNLPANVQRFSVWAGKVFESPQQAEWNLKFWNEFLPLIEQGKLAPNRIELLYGLESIIEGLKKLRDNKVSGKKQVVILRSTTQL